ncbi:MAG: RNase adapter RapZ [bacterium]
MVEQSIRTYIQRDFTHLTVAFGCTGGQHRSVYCAELLAKYLSDRYPVKIRLAHQNLG